MISYQSLEVRVYADKSKSKGYFIKWVVCLGFQEEKLSCQNIDDFSGKRVVSLNLFFSCCHYE